MIKYPLTQGRGGGTKCQLLTLTRPEKTKPGSSPGTAPNSYRRFQETNYVIQVQNVFQISLRQPLMLENLCTKRYMRQNHMGRQVNYTSYFVFTKAFPFCSTWTDWECRQTSTGWESCSSPGSLSGRRRELHLVQVLLPNSPTEPCVFSTRADGCILLQMKNLKH